MTDAKYSKEVLALALAREAVASLKRVQPGTELPEDLVYLVDAFDVLDNVGVFSPVDRQTDYTAAADILAANASDRFVSSRGLAHSQVRHPAGRDLPVTPETSALDAAEWADTTRQDMAGHQGLGPRTQELGAPLPDVTQGRSREEFRQVQNLDRGSVYGRDPKPGSHLADEDDGRF